MVQLTCTRSEARLVRFIVKFACASRTRGGQLPYNRIPTRSAAERTHSDSNISTVSLRPQNNWTRTLITDATCSHLKAPTGATPSPTDTSLASSAPGASVASHRRTTCPARARTRTTSGHASNGRQHAGASGHASRSSAPPFAPQPGPWRGRAPRQRPADRAVDVAFGRRRATANAAAVAAAPSLARLPAKNEVLVDRAAPGERLVVPAGEGVREGGTQRTVSEPAAVRHAAEAVGHAKGRGGGRDADPVAARWLRRAQREAHNLGRLRLAFGPQAADTTVRRGAGSTARACGSGRKKAA
jgi:hypothetical protein